MANKKNNNPQLKNMRVSANAPLIVQNFPEGIISYSTRPCVKCMTLDGDFFYMRLADYEERYSEPTLKAYYKVSDRIKKIIQAKKRR